MQVLKVEKSLIDRKCEGLSTCTGRIQTEREYERDARFRTTPSNVFVKHLFPTVNHNVFSTY